jgi:hypothetical protein
MGDYKLLLTPDILAHEFSDLMKKSHDCRVMQYYDISSDDFSVLWWADGHAVQGPKFSIVDLALSLDDFSERFVKPVVAAFEAGVAGEMPMSVLHKHAQHLCPSFYCTVLKANHG